eukprot:CAMPEP_0118633094 /NCGR_PEP_ID=MMETSP0785-20121206/804_1 /TAXON_ID=91992 /ORGANISM="Bolidomonas pacifica, Strain CCMP 1866" /LENGTH=391 /DNA_ID=CAMNT_0006523927 /DNA_START=127 /DNA_END=1299 /DNA_ORIENTATION=-
MSLPLPASHDLSSRLSSSLPLPPFVPQHCTSTSSPSEGIISLTITLPQTSLYSFRPWPLLIGGYGIGNDLDVAFGGPPRRPIMIRIHNALVSCKGIDEGGVISDETFWSSLPDPPTIESIVKEVVNLFERGSEEDAAFARAKYGTGETFRSSRIKDQLLKNDFDVKEHISREVAENLCSGSKGSEGRPSWLDEPSPGVFTFPLFPPNLCDLFLESLDAFESTDLPRRRPNTMNNFGLILNEIGMEGLAQKILEDVVSPLSRILFSKEVFTESLDHTHTFTVEYEPDKDAGLDMHHDASEVTLNVCLGRDFKGGGLRFCGEFGSADYRKSRLCVEHERGRAVLHLGRIRHAAADIEQGKRVNLIMWARSSAFRAAAAYGHVQPDGYPREKEG